LFMLCLNLENPANPVNLGQRFEQDFQDLPD